MRLNTQAVVERMVELLYDNLEKPALYVLETLQSELRTREQEEEARIRQMTADSLYHVARVDLVDVWSEPDEQVRRVVKPVERFVVRYADLGAFAKEQGLKIDELMAVLEFRRLEVVGKGGKVYRSGDKNRRYDQRNDFAYTKARKERGSIAAEDNELARSIARRAAEKKSVKAYIEPVVKEWKVNV